MADVPERRLADAAEVAQAKRSEARDERDVRSDTVTTELLSMVRGLQERVLDHMTEEGESVQELKKSSQRIEEKVDAILSAFPNKDPGGHLRDHEVRIKDAEKRDAFREKMKFAFWALVMTAIAGWLGVVAWKAFLLGPKP